MFLHIFAGIRKILCCLLVPNVMPLFDDETFEMQVKTGDVRALANTSFLLVRKDQSSEVRLHGFKMLQVRLLYPAMPNSIGIPVNCQKLHTQLNNDLKSRSSFFLVISMLF